MLIHLPLVKVNLLAPGPEPSSGFPATGLARSRGGLFGRGGLRGGLAALEQCLYLHFSILD